MTLEESPAPSAAGHPCCEEFARRISDLHDGRWPAGSGDCAKVEEHLAECPRCTELLDDYKLLSQAAEALRATKVSDACAEFMGQRVRARIRRQIFRRRLKWTGAGLAVAAAASVAVAIAIFPDAVSDAPGNLETVAAGDDAREKIKDAPPERIDLLSDPAVAALLKKLREEALREKTFRREDSDDYMTIQEQVDLFQEWGVSRAPGIGLPPMRDDLDGFRLPLNPRSGPFDRPGVVPVGGSGR